MPNLARGRRSFTYYEGALGIPESNAPHMLGRSWTLHAALRVFGDEPRGVVATMGGRAAGWALYLDHAGKAAFTYRTFEVARVELRGTRLEPGHHALQVDFDYDGGGRGRAATVTLTADGDEAASGRLPATPPAVFSIDETFDVGVNIGSPVGEFTGSYPMAQCRIERVDIDLAES